MPHPLIGKPAPALTLLNHDGETHTMTPGATGVPIALFFYPESGTTIARPSEPCAEEADFASAVQGRSAAQRRPAIFETRLPVIHCPIATCDCPD